MATKTKERDPLIGHDDAASIVGGNDLSGLLAEMATTLQQAAQDEAAQATALNDIVQRLTKLPDDAKRKLAQMPVFQQLAEVHAEHVAQQRPDDRPGTVYSGMIAGIPVKAMTKKPWTESDLRKLVERGEMPVVDFMPWTTQPVIWNSLVRNFIARRRIRVEKCFVDVYLESQRLTEVAEEHAAWLFKKRNSLPSDPGVITPEGARARGTGTEGHYLPGGGNIAGAVMEETDSEGEGESGEAA